MCPRLSPTKPNFSLESWARNPARTRPDPNPTRKTRPDFHLCFDLNVYQTFHVKILFCYKRNLFSIFPISQQSNDAFISMLTAQNIPTNVTIEYRVATGTEEARKKISVPS